MQLARHVGDGFLNQLDQGGAGVLVVDAADYDGDTSESFCEALGESPADRVISMFGRGQRRYRRAQHTALVAVGDRKRRGAYVGLVASIAEKMQVIADETARKSDFSTLNRAYDL